MSWVCTHLCIDDLKPESIMPFSHINSSYVIVRSKSGGLAAFADECSHQPVPLSEFGEIRGDILICHAHGACFGLDSTQTSIGCPLAGPSQEPLKVIPTKVDQNGLIYLKLLN